MAYSARAGAAPVADVLIGAPDDGRSVSVRQIRANRWKKEIKSKPPIERIAWLCGAEGLAELGAKQCRAIVRDITIEHERVKAFTITPAWIEDWFKGRATLPAKVGSPERERPGAVRLQLSREKTRIGMDGVASRRWTPPQAVELEDELDGMTVNEAIFYNRPGSPSAEVIRRIGEAEARPVSGNW